MTQTDAAQLVRRIEQDRELRILTQRVAHHRLAAVGRALEGTQEVQP